MDTSIPTGTIEGSIILELIDCVFWIITVQMLAPMRMNMVPTIAKPVDAKKVKLFLATPLNANL